MERDEQRDHIGREELDGVCAARLLRQPVAAKVQGNAPIAGRQCRELHEPIIGARSEAVDEDDRRRADPPRLVSQLHAVNLSKWHCSSSCRRF